MVTVLHMPPGIEEQNRQLTAVVRRERARLWNFIRRRVGDDADAEEILQEVFGELIEAYRLLRPIEQLGAWLLRVARNRVIDRFRRRRGPQGGGQTYARPTALRDADDDDELSWEALLPSPAAGPEAQYARDVLLEELQAALAELPPEQREIFVAHEFEGRSFRELAAASGLPLNTLLARKRYAVLHLRTRLRAIYDELMF
jgi:RNA polymerase sigma factor (sigma-70 family)